jgi:hypothetical protein
MARRGHAAGHAYSPLLRQECLLQIPDRYEAQFLTNGFRCYFNVELARQRQLRRPDLGLKEKLPETNSNLRFVILDGMRQPKHLKRSAN